MKRIPSLAIVLGIKNRQLCKKRKRKFLKINEINLKFGKEYIQQSINKVIDEIT